MEVPKNDLSVVDALTILRDSPDLPENLAYIRNEFPENRHDLNQGTVLRYNPHTTSTLIVPEAFKDKNIILFYDGRYVRCMTTGMNWSAEQLCGEIDQGLWTIEDRNFFVLLITEPERAMELC